MTKTEILTLSLDQLKDWMRLNGHKAFNAIQVYEWVYKKHAINFDVMSNLSKTLRELLNNHFVIQPFIKKTVYPAKNGSATKYVFICKDNLAIESVVIHNDKDDTLCLSSQVGCAVNCSFCLTGKMGLLRQCSYAEIVSQYLVLKHTHPKLKNIVFMGMGEPLHNLKAVLPAIECLTDAKRFELGKRHITVSTSGYLAGLKKLIKENTPLNLAFSVGHANPLKRIDIIPAEERNPIIEAAKLLKEYLSMHNRKLTLEYTLLKNTNEDLASLKALRNLAKYLDAKVNMINLNPHPKIPHQPVDKETLIKCSKWLNKEGIVSTIRFAKGDDVTAACGQLGESHLSTI